MGEFANGFAVVIGIAEYAEAHGLPKEIRKDAEDLSAVLQDPTLCGYPKSQVRLLTDKEATAKGIRNQLRWLAEETVNEDTAIFFFSGHGGRVMDGQFKGNYLLPFDTKLGSIKETAIHGDELTKLLHSIKAGRLLVLFDCCHAGGIGEPKALQKAVMSGFKSGLNEGIYDQLGQGQGRVIIASSKSDEVSYILSDMENSLFTHYLLQALRGEGIETEDGLIRHSTIFNFISRQVTRYKKDQHPIIHAHHAEDFPIALFPSKKDSAELGIIHRHLPDPTIVRKPGIEYPLEIEPIMKTLFAGFAQILVEEKIESGFSGCLVFIVQPDGKLPSVIKIGPRSKIETEYNAHVGTGINDLWVNAAHIVGTPEYTKDRVWGGLRYQLVGGQVFEIQSLYEYCQVATTDEIVSILEESLFPQMKRVWAENSTKLIRFQDSYDRLLPVNLMLALHALVEGSPKPRLIRGSGMTFKAGDFVRLHGFEAAETGNGTITLNVLTSHDSYRTRLQLWGQDVQLNWEEDIDAVVQETRDGILREQVNTLLGSNVTLPEEITLPGLDLQVPNPIQQLDAILTKPRRVKLSHIHGDLNLQNVLVFPESKIVSFIDFAHSRYDHIFHDLLRVETGIVTHILPKALNESGFANSPALAIFHIYQHLHNTINKSIAQSPVLDLPEKPVAMLRAIRAFVVNNGYLASKDDWQEYYDGLAIYLLGSLKFEDVTREGKQLAFWGAATALYLSQVPYEAVPSSPCPELKDLVIDEIGRRDSNLGLFVASVQVGDSVEATFEPVESRLIQIRVISRRKLTIRFGNIRKAVSIDLNEGRTTKVDYRDRCWYAEIRPYNEVLWLGTLLADTPALNEHSTIVGIKVEHLGKKATLYILLVVK